MGSKISEAFIANPRTEFDGSEIFPISDGNTDLAPAAGEASVLRKYMVAEQPFRSAAQPGTAAQSLSGDGVFRSRHRIGRGTFGTISSSTTVSDDSNYLAWPDGIARFHSGTLILVYSSSPGHHDNNIGVCVQKLGVENDDDTVTWGSQTTNYDDPTKWVNPYGIMVTQLNRGIESLWRDTYTASDTTAEAGYVYTDDEGLTWSGWQDWHATSGFTGGSLAQSRAVQMPNGDLLQPIEGWNSGQTYLANNTVKLLKSTDNGTTWTLFVTVRTTADGLGFMGEGCMGLLDDGSLLMIYRHGTTASDFHYQSRSTNGGATWTTPVVMVPAGYGKPFWLQLSSGTVVFFTRQVTTKAHVLFASTDRGVTWGAVISIDATMYESEYGGGIELRNGKLLTVYGHQPTSSFANCDITTKMMTEDLYNFTVAGKELLDDATAGDQRTTLSAAARAQTDMMTFVIAAPVDGTVMMLNNAAWAFAITSVNTKSVSGTATLTVKNGSTALGGTANSVTSTEQAQAHSGTNTFAIGDDMNFTWSSSATPTFVVVTIHFTRTLA